LLSAAISANPLSFFLERKTLEKEAAGKIIIQAYGTISSRLACGEGSRASSMACVFP
jgi:hypothetical protein